MPISHVLAPTRIRNPLEMHWPPFSLRIYTRNYKAPDLHLTCVGKTKNLIKKVNFCLKNWFWTRSSKKNARTTNALTYYVSAYQHEDMTLQAISLLFYILPKKGKWYLCFFQYQIGAVCEYIKMLLENDGLKFLVFAHHKEVLTALAQTVAAFTKEHKTQLKYIRIDGDVPSSERMVCMNLWSEGGTSHHAWG